MDFTKLYVGQIIKNYKELCKILGIECKSSDSKKAVIKELERHCRYEKQGNKFIVLEVYEVALEKTDNRKLGNNSKYVENIEYILLNILSQSDGYKSIFTKSNLFEYLGMINPLYLQKSLMKAKLPLQDDRIKLYDINHFYQRTNQRLTKILFDALNNLKNRFLISYKEINVIVRCDDKGKEVYSEAIDDEINWIRDAKRMALDEMELRTIQQVSLKFKMEEFFRIVNRILKVEHAIERTFTQYEILFTKEYILKELDYLETTKHQKELNDKVVDTINDNARKNFIDNEKEYNTKLEEILLNDMIFGDNYASSKCKIFKYHEDYIDVQIELADHLLKLD